MKIGYYAGAMYVEIEDEKIDISPIELGDKVLRPGQFISKLGHKKRTSFEMQDGWYLRYIGRVDNYLLFNTNCDTENKNMYYTFAYVDKTTLLIGVGNGSRDIRVETIKIYDNVTMKYLDQQMSLI